MAEWLVRGLGWAWLPRHVVQYPTYQGQMVELSSEWTRRRWWWNWSGAAMSPRSGGSLAGGTFCRALAGDRRKNR
jgi:DNA-binding transcriptional LysR family regulator